MKKILLYLSIICIAASCNNDNKPKRETKTADGPVDSLLNIIDEAHNVGMSKVGKLHMARQRAQEIIDSIGKLPAKVRDAAAGYVERLKTSISEIDYADTFMDKWMMEYNEDSIKDNINKRIEYLRDETMKVGKMKEAIVNSLNKTDSLIRAQF